LKANATYHHGLFTNDENQVIRNWKSLKNTAPKIKKKLVIFLAQQKPTVFVFFFATTFTTCSNLIWMSRSTVNTTRSLSLSSGVDKAAESSKNPKFSQAVFLGSSQTNLIWLTQTITDLDNAANDKILILFINRFWKMSKYMIIFHLKSNPFCL